MLCANQKKASAVSSVTCYFHTNCFSLDVMQWCFVLFVLPRDSVVFSLQDDVLSYKKACHTCEY